jgi:hypothetical protein
MMRIRTVAVCIALAGALAWPAAGASAQTASTILRTAKPSQPPVVTDASAQRRRPTRLRVTPNYRPDDVYPRYFPGRNAVRDCTATYVQEYRPSGTVIVPHMNCYWRRG